MVKLSATIKDAFQRVFPERQVYHRSGGTVQYISISPWQQFIIATGALLIFAWCAFATIAYLVSAPTNGFGLAESGEVAKYERWVQELRAKDALSRTLLQERTDDFERATQEFEKRHQTLTDLLEALNGGEELEVSALRGDNAAFLIEASIEEADPRQSRERSQQEASIEVVGIRAQIDDLRQEHQRFLDAAEEIAVARAERARGVLRLTAVGSSRFGVNTEVGGPLVAVSALGLTESSAPEEIAFAERVSQVAARLEEARYYEDVVASLPLGDPIGVDYRLTSPYGLRTDPFTRRPNWHNGLDLAAFWRAPIVAAGPGEVIFAGVKSGYGRVVFVDHGHGFVTRYGHMRSLSVSRGDKVAIGDTLGLMGSSGRSTGPHLHYEVWLNDKPYNPTDFLKAGQHVHQ